MKKKNKIDLSIVIPCYNEKNNIPLVVKRFVEIKPENINSELVLVDNGSTDNSKAVIQKFADRHSFIKIVKIKKNIGYGSGVWRGLKSSKGNFLCWTHADMQTDVKDAIGAYNIINLQPNPKKCFVKGNRKKRPLFDSFFAFGMSLFETAILGKYLYDINAQPNLFHRDFLKCIKTPPNDFSFDLYFYYMAKKMNFNIIRFPVSFRPRVHGQSSWNTGIKEKIKFIKRTMEFTFKLKKIIGGAND